MRVLSEDRRIVVLLAALVVGVLATVVLGWLYWRAQSQAQMLDERGEVLQENVGRLRLLDETLTLSARLVAVEDDPRLEERYEERYDEADAELVGLTEETLNLFLTPEVERRFGTVEGPTDRLLALEERAFALDREGRDSEALGLLEGPEYERYKRRYIEGLDAATFAALQDAEEQERQRLEAYQLALLGAGGLGLALVFFGWAFAIGTLLKRRRAEEESARLASIVQNSTDAIDSKSLDGTIISWNPGAEKLYGYSEEEIKGKNVSILTPPDRIDEMKEISLKVARGETVSDYETERISKDGRRVPTSLTTSPVRDSANAIVGTSTIARDLTERKRYEEELGLQKTLLEAQSEASIDGILVVSHDRTIRSFNRRFVEMWEVPEEVIATRAGEDTIRAVLDKLADPEEFLAGVARLYEHQDEESRDEILLKDGRAFDRYSAPVKSADGAYYGRVWYFRDITERKQAEERLAESERRFSTLLANAPAMVYRCLNEDDWPMEFVSEYARELTGYLPETFSKGGELEYGDLILEQDRERVWNKVQDALEGHERFRLDYSIRCEDGAIKHVEEFGQGIYDEEGNVVALEGLIIDATERKRTEEERAFLASIVRSSSDAIYSVTPDGTIVTWNRGAERLFGYSAEEIIGQSIRVLCPTELRHVQAENLEKARRGQSVEVQETVRITKDGRRRYVSLTVSPIEDSRGNVVRASTIVRDVTERKQAEEDFRESELRFRQLLAVRRRPSGPRRGRSDGRLQR
ncbi:MAG: PAS domain S-box protein [Actinomycetota bacterium]|nr:PAS domain S-box protein [Actinomycetota bacterium]